jgi:hypothetical protein
MATTASDPMRATCPLGKFFLLSDRSAPDDIVSFKDISFCVIYHFGKLGSFRGKCKILEPRKGMKLGYEMILIQMVRVGQFE